MKKAIFFIVVMCLISCSFERTYDTEKAIMPQTTNDGFSRIADTKYYIQVCDNGQIGFGEWSNYGEEVRGNGMDSRALLVVCNYLKPKIDKYVGISSKNNVKEYNEYVDVDDKIVDYKFIWCRAEYIRDNYNDFVEINDRGHRSKIRFTYHEFNEVIKALEKAVSIANPIQNKIKTEKERIKALYK